MVTVMLRIRGELVDVDAWRRRFPEGALQSAQRLGDVSRNGEVVTVPSVSILLAEGPNDVATLAAHRSFVRLAEELAPVVESGATVDVDFGVFVTAKAPQSVHLDTEFLRLLQVSGVGVWVRAYPCSD